MEFLTFLSSFWAIAWTVLLIACLVTAEEVAQPIASFFLLVLFVAIGDLSGLTTITRSIIEEPWRFFVGLLIYLVVGVLWATFKFHRFLARNPHHLGGSYRNQKIEDRVTQLMRYFKSRIVQWMAFWPISMLWTLLSDFVIRLWERVYDLASSLFRRIAQSAIERYDSENPK